MFAKDVKSDPKDAAAVPDPSMMEIGHVGRPSVSIHPIDFIVFQIVI